MKNDTTPEAQTGQAIYCQCYNEQYKRYKILGSINQDGLFEIRRGQHEVTVIATPTMFLFCRECNFKRYIQLPQVTTDFIYG